jgi:hypothetical protein
MDLRPIVLCAAALAGVTVAAFLWAPNDPGLTDED